jgi:hypothetical protein
MTTTRTRRWRTSHSSATASSECTAAALPHTVVRAVPVCASSPAFRSSRRACRTRARRSKRRRWRRRRPRDLQSVVCPFRLCSALLYSWPNPALLCSALFHRRHPVACASLRHARAVSLLRRDASPSRGVLPRVSGPHRVTALCGVVRVCSGQCALGRHDDGGGRGPAGSRRAEGAREADREGRLQHGRQRRAVEPVKVRCYTQGGVRWQAVRRAREPDHSGDDARIELRTGATVSPSLCH